MPHPENVVGKGNRWKKGESGNSKGRPKKLPGLDELIDKVLGESRDGVTAMEVILRAIRAKAARGDVRAAEILLERSYGKVKQEIDLSDSRQAIADLFPIELDDETKNITQLPPPGPFIEPGV
jgi:Family of unknown function (DUF5681)